MLPYIRGGSPKNLSKKGYPILQSDPVTILNMSQHENDFDTKDIYQFKKFILLNPTNTWLTTTIPKMVTIQVSHDSSYSILTTFPRQKFDLDSSFSLQVKQIHIEEIK